MPKEWTGPSEYFAAGLYGSQNRKAIFRSVLTPEGHSRSLNSMEFEEAADLSLKKSKPNEPREKVYPSPYAIDESMDLSTKWRPTAEQLTPTHAVYPPSHQHRKRSKQHHSRMLPPRKPPRPPSPDVIVLSEDEGRLNGHMQNGRDPSPPRPPPAPLGESERRLLREIRDQLRSEEMKLVLLKKLHQSQLLKESGQLLQGGKKPPPPLVRQAPPPQGGKLPSSSLLNTPPLQATSHGGPPPLIGQQRGGVSSSSSSLIGSLMRPGHSSRAPVTTPPNPFNPMHTLQQQQASSNPISLSQANRACSSPLQQQESSGGSPAQRQAAAKLALRKQLEKTLLQIPPPKPPPPEMHFVPNANNQEFVCLLGLEKAVDVIIKDGVERPAPEPFECVQCGTDFSPVWKWQQQDATSLTAHASKPSVICETCVTSNVKKALKAEHTNRLKTAFVKALQQEQEIEQRMAPPPLSPPSPPPTRTPPPPPQQQQQQQLQLHMQLAQQQLQQHFAAQAHQPQPAHGMYPFGPLQAYSYQLLGGKSPAELQRQYLLDMIPPRSQGNWKT